MIPTQAAHTDADPEFSLGRKQDFGFIVIVGIEKRGFLDLKTSVDKPHPMRVLIERGGGGVFACVLIFHMLGVKI